MATAEEKLKMLIGELTFQNTFLITKLEEAQAEINALKEQTQKTADDDPEKTSVVKMKK